MTRKEAIEKSRKCGYGESIIDLMEALGLIEFDEVDELWYESENGKKWGTISISEYEGKLHLWVGGEHRYELALKDV